MGNSTGTSGAICFFEIIDGGIFEDCVKTSDCIVGF